MSSEPERNFTRPRGKLSPDCFEFGRTLGSGGYGTVYHARKLTGMDQGTIVAMKVIRKKRVTSKKKLENVESERSILGEIEHPFIIKLLYAFETHDTFYLALEYMRHGDLFTYLDTQEITEDRVRIYSAEVLLALVFLHENNILYRDLKPENVLIKNDGHIALSDFGLCKRLDSSGDSARTFCGTIDYMAPEALNKEGGTIASDLWSFGVLLYDMLVGCSPFAVYSYVGLRDRGMTMYNIKNCRFAFPDNADDRISLQVRDLITGLLVRDPEQRLQADDIFGHQFYSGLNFESLLDGTYGPLEMPPDYQREDSFVKRRFRSSEAERHLYDPNKLIFEDFDYTAPDFLVEEENSVEVSAEEESMVEGEVTAYEIQESPEFIEEEYPDLVIDLEHQDREVYAIQERPEFIIEEFPDLNVDLGNQMCQVNTYAFHDIPT